MIVKETIHHGDYHAVREVEVSDQTPDRFVDLITVVRDCTYITYTPEKAARIAGELATKGQSEQGWVRWEVLQ